MKGLKHSRYGPKLSDFFYFLYSEPNSNFWIQNRPVILGNPFSLYNLIAMIRSNLLNDEHFSKRSANTLGWLFVTDHTATLLLFSDSCRSFGFLKVYLQPSWLVWVDPFFNQYNVNCESDQKLMLFNSKMLSKGATCTQLKSWNWFCFNGVHWRLGNLDTQFVPTVVRT